MTTRSCTPPPDTSRRRPGEREVVPEEADIIRRIFKDYAAGLSTKQIAKDLNGEGLRGPRGALWSPSTIHGNPTRGIGILRNELYIGRMVWNRQRFLKDPDTGKRVARPNPRSEWITRDVPELRILDDELWQAVQTRYAGVQRKWKSADEGKRFNQFRRRKYLFSGLTKCGRVRCRLHVYSREQLGCFGTRDRGTCTNELTISRLEVEARVLSALQDKLMRKDFFEEFCREFAKETNRLRMEQRAGLSGAKRELERVRRGIQKVIDAIKAGYAGPELKSEMDDLQARKEALLAQLAAADEPPPLLHPSMADLYRSKVEELASALQREDTRLEASEMLRGLIDSIVLMPDEGQLRIELRGQSGCDVDRCPTNEKVARNGRPSRAGSIGCGGSQPTLSAALAPGSVGNQAPTNVITSCRTISLSSPPGRLGREVECQPVVRQLRGIIAEAERVDQWTEILARTKRFGGRLTRRDIDLLIQLTGALFTRAAPKRIVRPS